MRNLLHLPGTDLTPASRAATMASTHARVAVKQAFVVTEVSPAARPHRRSHRLAAAAFAAVACFGAAPSFGKALASASVEITSLVWKRALGSSPAAGDPVLTTRFLFPAPPGQQARETVLRGGTEFFQFSGDLDGTAYSSFEQRFISASDGLGPLMAGACEGAGCPSPSDFNPLTPPPVSDFSGNYGDVDGYFSNMANNPAIQPLTQGVRADVSLNALESGSSAGVWDSSTILDSTGTFDTYFEIEFEAHALAYADSTDQVASADASLVLSVSGGLNALNVSLPVFALSSLSSEANNNKTLTGSLNSYAALGQFIQLVPTPAGSTSYSVRVVAETNASAGVPLPGAVWLLGAGLIPLAAVRARSARRGRLPRAA
jgi:hypothetical protein